MKATLTVKKSDLRDKLVGRMAEVRISYENSERVSDVRKLLEKLQNGESHEQFTERILTWHKKVVAGLEDGSITVNVKGHLHNSPAKPVRDKFMSQWGRHWTVDEAEKAIRDYEQQLIDELKPFETAIEILDMSTGENVEINSGDYNDLLMGRQRYRW